MFNTLIPYIPIFSRGEIVFIISILLMLMIDMTARRIKRQMKKSIFAQYDDSTDPEHAEYYLEYYRRSQIIDVVRMIIVSLFIVTVIATNTANGFNLFVVAAGAFLVIFKDLILSIVAFFFILPQYRIGNTIAIGDIQGQIIFIRMLTIGILGKDNDGDNTGRLFVLPSHRLLSENIRKEDLQANSIRKELLRIPYITDQYQIPFDEFTRELEGFLGSYLPTLDRKNCGNYQTYIGHKYKIDFDYLEDKCIIITLGLVGRWEQNSDKKRRIMEWVETKKKKL